MPGRVRMLPLLVLLVVALSVPPAASAATLPGSLISVSPLPAQLWLPGTARAHHVHYWSTGLRDEPVPVTGAIFVPEGNPPPGGWPILSWAHGTVGLGDDCAPSTAGRSARDIEYLAHWLSQGYVIVASDYLGLGAPGLHPYLIGEPTAYSVIDMVRAAVAADPALSRKWAVIGQSQGGHATLFTTRLAPSYAPDLDFRGGVGTGVPSHLEYLISATGPWLPDIGQPGLTVFVSYIIASLRAAYPEAHIDSYLSPLGRSVIADAEHLCYWEQHARVRGIGIGSLFSRQLTDAPFFTAIRDAMEVPVSGYERPFFIAQGGVDVVVWAPLTELLAAQLRATGQPAAVRYYPNDNHDSTMAASLGDTTPFLARLMR
ncbi:lipase [Hoyosella sp. YIM 151337]|uniref:lipase family protein n=1 Tax=Hoyosella sp. YIM 151337 TaxID=2992742 RepID=UPI0022361BC0|nr:lipase family protein [Hoyosella sp. YIM 151337]MCW4355486.1 lipase [Hoyosella sp. YIM 151337]